MRALGALQRGAPPGHGSIFDPIPTSKVVTAVTALMWAIQRATTPWSRPIRVMLYNLLVTSNLVGKGQDYSSPSLLSQQGQFLVFTGMHLSCTGRCPY